MRQAILAALVVVCSIFGFGCYDSLISIVTPDKQVFYEDLVGEYRGVEPSTGKLKIARGEAKAYRYEQLDDQDLVTGKGTLKLIKVGEHHFYELGVDGMKTVDGKPVYAIGRAQIEGSAGAKKLTGFGFASKEEFFDDPAVTTAEYVYKEDGEEKKARAVSMPAEKLQAYLAANAGKMSEVGIKYEQVGKGK